MRKSILLLSLVAIAAPSSRGAPLANGCAVESVAFTVEYLAKNPAEHAFVLVLEPVEPAGAGHAVCVYGKGDLIYVHDHELGDYLVGNDREALRNLRRAVDFRNRQILAAHRKAGALAPRETIDEEREVGRALARLPPATRPIAITVACRGALHAGVAFLFDRKVWVYLPTLGSGQAGLAGTGGYAAAIEKNLSANFPGAHLLRLDHGP